MTIDIPSLMVLVYTTLLVGTLALLIGIIGYSICKWAIKKLSTQLDSEVDSWDRHD